MTASHGVGTYGNAVGTVTPNDHKLGNAASFAKSTSSLAIRPGLMWGGADNIVTGTSGMTYNVAAFTAVLSRGGTSGAIPLANDGVVNVATTAAPGSNSRYDVVYIWQREYSLDGTDSNPVIGVLQGTVAASPTVPALTSFPGAIALANILVPAGVTATNTGTTITQTAPFTATAGGLVMFRNTTEQSASILPQGTLSALITDSSIWSSTGSAWVSSLGDTGWVAMTLANSWLNFGSGYEVAQYRRKNGVVFLMGLIKSGTSTLGTTLTTLPAGFRPSGSFSYATTANGTTYGSIQIDATGNVEIVAGGASASAGGLSLVVSFIAEA